MDITYIIGQNIDKLREQHNISVESLAEMVGVTRQTMTNYLKGRQTIDSSKLNTLAGYLNKPFEYFLTESYNEFSLMFRADNPRENFDGKLAEKIIQSINNTCNLLEVSGQKLTLVPESYKLRLTGKKLNREDKELIEEIAIKKRQEFGIAEIVPENIYQILQEHEINVISFPFNNSAIYAVSAYSTEYGCFIVINDDANISEEKKIFSCLHELGHLIFHKEQYAQNFNLLSHVYGKGKNVYEELANHFAMCFLVPRSLLKKYKNIFRSKVSILSDVIEIKKHLQVSAKCLIYALDYYGYITEKQKGIHIGYLNQNGFRTEEPRPMQVFVKNIFWETMIKELYVKEKISLSKICELLKIPVARARELTRDWLVAQNQPETIL